MQTTPASMPATPNLIDPSSLALSAESAPEEVARSFESVFASLLLKEMRNTLTEGLFGSESSDVLGGLFDLHMGQAMSEGQGLGIRNMILSQLQKQEAAPSPLVSGETER